MTAASPCGPPPGRPAGARPARATAPARTPPRPALPRPALPRGAPAPAPAAVPATAVQASFDELGTPLRSLTFVVVDLETTGGSAAQDEITEIGAVRVRGGEVLGEFQTLIRPTVGIPPLIAVLTGITDHLVVDAPRLDQALPPFLDFAAGAVLVAHNAPFDLGFLRAATTRLHLPPLTAPVLDTARLARRALTRDEAPNCRLATLARLFASRTVPVHRALADARATVDVLHGLLERVGSLGVHSLEELLAYSTAVPDEVRRKRHLAADVPAAPGVYLFRDDHARPLYVGTSTNLRARVRQYFTAAETRTRMTEMVRHATRVDTVVCATPLEAEVRELRMIVAERPRYNRRSRRADRPVYVTLTRERFPRLSVVRDPRPGAGPYLGPFTSAAQADRAVAALHEAIAVRQCRTRLSPRRPSPACLLAQIGRCSAPCTGAVTPEDYAAVPAAVQRLIAGADRAALHRLRGRVERLGAAGRYEDAAKARDRLTTLARALTTGQEHAGLRAVPELVAARRLDSRYELHVIRHGRLVAAAFTAAGADPRHALPGLLAAAESVPAVPAGGEAPPGHAALPAETSLLLRWLRQPGVRLVAVSQPWCSPAAGAAAVLAELGPAGAAAAPGGPPGALPHAAAGMAPAVAPGVGLAVAPAVTPAGATLVPALTRSA